ncbi:glycoside hydrolase family 1 protein [Microbacterium hominis]|uniref:Glycoside hydrolase family 1 protein n=1 Tax=Microbacterium hominis TaxID=162426 RepID=A0A7D4PP36_9MICO|nr:family 1 glycosylhydrolase [Microbacterium hominis]QKJ20510.1 glycoside hydrolase family 1 protein [Microbacterium hominis]
MTSFPDEFLWGASTAPHQIEGNNTTSDWWAREGMMPGMELSGDAVDSYHRYSEDIALLAEAGLDAYRFGIEWARVEPRQGSFSRAELAHYRRMIDTCLAARVTPVVTLNHFSMPAWFAHEGGWASPQATERFSAYVEKVTEILDGVEWVVTINEPNMLAMMTMVMEAMRSDAAPDWQSPTVEADSDRDRIAAALPVPTIGHAAPLIAAHQAARDILRERTSAKVGWSIANGAFYADPEDEQKLVEVRYAYEDVYLEASRGDDFVGVQSYSAQRVDKNGLVPHPGHPDNTMVGTAYRPDSLATAVRHAAAVSGVPVLVTENGIATPDDARRIAYTAEALTHLEEAMHDGVDVRGYLHWSLLDNYEWGHWGPTFGLIAVDRETFVRTPKTSLAWLGAIAQSNGADLPTVAEELQV